MSRQGPLGAAHSQSDRYRRRLLAAAGLSNNLLFGNLNYDHGGEVLAPRGRRRRPRRLGALSGYLAKRDEQHQWRRFASAPRPRIASLYYFEDSQRRRTKRV